MSADVSGIKKLLIPFPIKLGMRRGMCSMNANGRAVAVRMHNDDLDLLHEEAKHLGISRGELMRWLCVYGAVALHKERTGNHIEVTP